MKSFFAAVLTILISHFAFDVIMADKENFGQLTKETAQIIGEGINEVRGMMDEPCMQY